MALAASMGGRIFIGSLVDSFPGRRRAGGFVALRSREPSSRIQCPATHDALRGRVGVVLALISRSCRRARSAARCAGSRSPLGKCRTAIYSVTIECNRRTRLGAVAGLQEPRRGPEGESGPGRYMMAASGGAGHAAACVRADVVREAGGQLHRARFSRRYEVKEILGVGGMGVVYGVRSRATRAGRDQDAEAGGDGGRHRRADRFKQEIRLARRIAHRNSCARTLGELNGMYYLTMEYVEGTSLKQLITSRGRLPVAVTLTVGKQLCRALEIAHAERHYSPRHQTAEHGRRSQRFSEGDGLRYRSARQSAPGQRPDRGGIIDRNSEYMSPEQLSGADLDPRSDSIRLAWCCSSV